MHGNHKYLHSLHAMILYERELTFGWSVVHFEVIQTFLSFISIHLGNIGAEKYNELNIQVNEWLKNLFHDKSFAWIYVEVNY